MNLLRQKPSIKILVSVAIVFLLVCGVYFAVFFKKDNTSEINTELFLSLSITPTPYPLPAKVYTSPSYLTTILSQIFRNKNKLVNPSLIIGKSQIWLSNEYLDSYLLNEYDYINAQWWQEESKQVYEYVSNRLDMTINQKVIVVFVPPETGNCAPRGTTFHEQRPIIEIFADQDTNREQILAVLAHELGHVFNYQKYENLSDVALNEGMATWAAGDYWEAWTGADFDTGVHSFIMDKTYMPLFQNYDMSKAYDDKPGCINRRNILLTEFASFLDYLIRNYGFEKLSMLFDIPQPTLMNNQRIVYQPNYKDIYELELNQLEYEWLKTLPNESNQ